MGAEPRATGGASRAQRRGASIASRLAATLLGVGFVSLVAATVVGLQAGQMLGEEIIDDRLVSTRAVGSTEVAALLGHQVRLVEQLAAAPGTAATIRELDAALEVTASQAEVRAARERLAAAYEESYLTPLKAIEPDIAMSDILTTDPAAVLLQDTYSVPEGPVADPIAVTDAGDGSAWTTLHTEIHPHYRDVVRAADLLDVYLVDLSSDRVVYSAAKGPDLGTSLTVGPFSGSVVARAVDLASSSQSGVVTDLSFYRGVPGIAVGAAAAPVVEDGEVVGAVVITYDGTVLTERLGSLVAAAAGPDSRARADLFLIGADGRLRSDPSTYLADPESFLDAAVAAGTLTPADRSAVATVGSTVLVERADDATVNLALDGVTEVSSVTGMTGAAVLSTAAAVPVDDVGWFVVSQLDTVDARATIASFRRILLVGAAVFVVGLAFAAVAWSTRFLAPVRLIADRLARSVRADSGSDEPAPVALDGRSAVELQRLAGSLTEMGRSLRHQQHDLREARERRLAVLQRMLPAGAAQRFARGEVDSVDEVPSATVAVVVVLGLGEIAGAPGGVGRQVLDELHADLDGIAAEHGLDRIKVVGDSYFAVCGHDRPYIDHAPRALAFAEQVAASVRATSAAVAVPLETSIGISTGEVTVAMSGAGAVVYDVWGRTVTTAHTLARSGAAGDILLTEATRTRLPRDSELSAWREDDAAPVWRLVERDDPVAGTGSTGTEVIP